MKGKVDIMANAKQMRIGIVGYGTMGQAIGDRIKEQYCVIVFDKDKSKTKEASGVLVAPSVEELVKDVVVLILAVKPQDFDAVLTELRRHLGNVLLISIAAGVTTKRIEHMLKNARVVRVMPNIGAKIGESVTCLCKGQGASDTDLALSEELWYRMGVTKIIPEELFDAATAISGSGPAYIFDFIQVNDLNPHAIPEHAKHDMIKRLKDAAEAVGFDSETAAFLAVNTAHAAFELMKKTQSSPLELRDQVTSKGGTTEAALAVIHKGGSWKEAAEAALKRAKELSR
ncbi:MAG: pyrroline-5-carboxylate reductase [Candidatus Omnitrophica bacterium]|nr:pyrroline-5-carboxylate reductase [Candidatus Omnitrophota bacterium]